MTRNMVAKPTSVLAVCGGCEIPSYSGVEAEAEKVMMTIYFLKAQTATSPCRKLDACVCVFISLTQVRVF